MTFRNISIQWLPFAPPLTSALSANNVPTIKLITSRFLIISSCVVTLAFMLTVYFGFIHPVHSASRVADFDRIRAHRIDLVEPDGTKRLILSNRSDYPGSFYHGKEVRSCDWRAFPFFLTTHNCLVIVSW